MTEVGTMMLDSARRILEKLGAPARESGDHVALCQAFEAAGFLKAMGSEDAGGAGVAWADIGALFFELGRHGVPAPMVETMLGSWAWRAAEADLPYPEGIVAISMQSLDARHLHGSWLVTGTLSRVPWARYASSLLVIFETAHGPHMGWIDDPGRYISRQGVNLAGEARDTMTFDGVAVQRVVGSSVTSVDLLAAGATARSAMMAGALARVLELCVEYAVVRNQFGKPIASFQAVQHALAQLASLAAAARASAADAFVSLDRVGDHQRSGCLADLLSVASAKVYCGEASGQGAMLSHQVFGAIGFAEEHSLHRYTKRLWSWRDEYRNEAWWANRMGEQFLRAGGAALWPAITAAGAMPST